MSTTREDHVAKVGAMLIELKKANAGKGNAARDFATRAKVEIPDMTDTTRARLMRLAANIAKGSA